MARYLVGADDDKPSLTDAIKVASDGDTIELEERYCPTVNCISLNKSLSFIGHVVKKEEGGQHFQNVITGQFFIKDGASVSFEHLWICWEKPKCNIINCREKSTLKMTNVVIESMQTEEEVYPVIYAKEKCQIKFEDVTIQENKKWSLESDFCDCNVEINDSSFCDCKIVSRNTELMMKDSKISVVTSNAIVAYNSTVTLNTVIVKGSNKEKKKPAIWSENSQIITNNCTVEQPEYEYAVNLIKNSYLKSDHDVFESIELNGGRGIFTASTIKAILQAESKSYAYIKDGMHIMGMMDQKIDLLLDKGSVLIGDEIRVDRIEHPNLRINNSSVISLQKIECTKDSSLSVTFEMDKDSRFIYQNELLRSGEADEKTEQNSESETEPQISAREQLNQMIGLKSVKKEIDKMLHLAEFNRQRIAKGLQPQEQSFHSVFLGNPGTGKTTVARLIGEVLYESGAFKSDEFKLIEASEPDFISENVGGTAQQTLALLEQAKGGVLFIDEAYALNKKGSSVDFGIEAINTIIKYMEDHRGEIMIIFAGYTKEMEQFLKTNPGLASRVPNKFVFEDYTPDEIVEIGERDLEKKMYTFEDREYYAQQVKRAYHASLDHSNARWIRNFNEKLLKVFAERVMNNGEEDLETIKKVDLDAALVQGKYQKAENEDDREQAFDRLQKMVGIEKVKEQVNRFISLAELNQRREEQGQMNQDFTLHSLFLGNPGTGKTTVARIIGEVLYQKGIIAEKKFIEASRSDLVAGYVGQTALKTREVLESALGGVLFIDEAYSLNSDSQNDFGLEAINEILKFMEDHRKDMVIIFAGYTKEMSEFLKQNSGLASRIPHTFDFEDYTPEEIVQIGLMGIHNAGYVVDESYYSEVVKNNYAQSKEHSNGRWVRNLNEQLIMVMSDRVAKSEDADINTILKEDLDVIAIHHQIIG